MDNNKETAQRWENVYRETPLDELPWEEGRPSIELVSLIESGTVEKGAALDICCGSGNNAVYLAKQGFTCYGIDVSNTAIEYAEERVNEAGVACKLTAGNALQLPFADNFFALVFDRGCFHNIHPQDRKTFIRGIHRVLKPGGKYQLICFSKKDHRSNEIPYSFSPEAIKRYFSRLFKIQHIREISRDIQGGKHYFLSVLMEKFADAQK